MGLVIFIMGLAIFGLVVSLWGESLKVAALATEVSMLRERYEPNNLSKVE